MEVKNNKDEVPFERYHDAYAALDPNEAAQRCCAKYENGVFSFIMMGEQAKLTFPEGELLEPEKLKMRILPARLLLVRYLLEGRKTLDTGRFLAYRDMPWGEVYNANFTGRCIQRSAFTFGTNVEGFARAMEKCGAVKSKEGDVSYIVEFLDGLWLKFIIWEGDDEFPPSAQILFSDNFSAAFTAEDMAVVGDVAIDRLKALMKED